MGIISDFDLQAFLREPLVPFLILVVIFVYIGLKYGLEKTGGRDSV